MSPIEYSVLSRSRVTPVRVRFLPAVDPLSEPHMIAPDASVSNESQLGRLVRKSLAKIPPEKVDVPPPDIVKASEVERWETDRPPVNVDVALVVRLIMPLERRMPSVIVRPPVEERPAVLMPPEKVDEAAEELLKMTEEFRTPPVRVSPSEEANPPVPTDKPVANVEVPARI